MFEAHLHHSFYRTRKVNDGDLVVAWLTFVFVPWVSAVKVECELIPHGEAGPISRGFHPREFHCQMEYKISPSPLLMAGFKMEVPLRSSGRKLTSMLWQPPFLPSYLTKSSLRQAKTSMDESHIKKFKFMDTKRQKINLESIWIACLWIPAQHWLPHLSFAQMNYLCPPWCVRVTDQKHFAGWSCEWRTLLWVSCLAPLQLSAAIWKIRHTNISFVC